MSNAPITLFIASSTENKILAEWIEELLIDLGPEFPVPILSTGWWEHGVFKNGYSFYESLNNILATCDGAIILAGADDLTIKRDKPNYQPRDNVVFELGLFAGNKGRDLALLATINLPHLPSDLAGISHLSLNYSNGMSSKVFKTNNRSRIRESLNNIIENISLRRKDTASDEFSDPDIKVLLNEIIKGVKDALSVKNEIFIKAVKDSLELYGNTINPWSRGEIHIGPEKSTPFLINLYKYAKTNVFSTSVKDFSGAWKDESFGLLLLEAHKSSPAKVTRVFLFSDIAQIESSDKDEMAKQNSLGIAVFVFIEQFAPLPFPTQIAKDFTIIDDGSIIGVTENIGNNRISAKYIFSNEREKRSFIQIKNRLENESMSYETFIRRFS
jgi:hypothetical protein